jgi:curved DNA-binding protein CbpA
MEHIGVHLKEIFSKRKSGQLIYRHNVIQKNLFFQKGDLVFAKTNHPKELLGEILYQMGKLSEEAHSKIESYIEPKIKIGEVLIEKSQITEEDLRVGLDNQMRVIVLSIFSAFEGDFKFEKGSFLHEKDFNIKINTLDLIEDGIRRMKFDPSTIQEFMGGKELNFHSKSYIYRLTEKEREILDAVKGKKLADDILSASDFKPIFFWKTLYLFYCLDLVDLKEGKEASGAPKEKKTQGGAEMDKHVAEVIEMSKSFESMNYYQILDVERDAELSSIKKSYFSLARKYHPDLFDRNLSHEIKEIIEEVFDKISKAYSTLSDESKRQGYDSKIDAMLAPEEGRRDWSKKAEIKFRQGKLAYKSGNYEAARILFEEAVRRQPSKGAYYIWLALVESKIPSRRKKSEHNFRKAIQLEPWNIDAYLGLGLLYRKVGLHIKARRQFEQVLKIDSDNVTALRELDLVKKTKKKLDVKDFLQMDVFPKKKK